MRNGTSLAERVKERTGDSHSPALITEILSKEALHALKLSERYSFIEPEPYILPLDTLAGFASKARSE